MKFKKLDIVFSSRNIQPKDILVVYEYGDYLIVKYQYYTSKLFYNFGQNQYGGFKEAWEHFFELRDNKIVDPQMYDLAHPMH